MSDEANEDFKVARLVITLPDGRTFSSALHLYDGIQHKNIRVQALHYEEWLRATSRTLGDWIMKGKPNT